MAAYACCARCGVALGAFVRFCPACGQECGAAIPAADQARPNPAPGPSPYDADLARGLAAMQAGDLDRALPLLAAAAEGGSGFALLAHGTALLRRRRYARAVEPLERAAALLPGRGEPLAYLGMARLHLLDPAGAREALDRAVAVAPGSFAVRLKRAEFLLRMGYYRESLAEADAALALAAPDAESLAFAERLAALARQKAPQAYTRRPGRLPLAGIVRRLTRRPARTAHLESLAQGQPSPS